MKEKSHSELESEHYRTVRSNPYYAQQGLMDVLMEESMMAWPVSPQPPILEVPESEAIQQLRVEIQQIRKQMVEMQNKRDTASFPDAF